MLTRWAASQDALAQQRDEAVERDREAGAEFAQRLGYAEYSADENGGPDRAAESGDEGPQESGHAADSADERSSQAAGG